MSTQLTMTLGPNEFPIGTTAEDELQHGSNILTAPLTSQPTPFSDLSASSGVSLMQIEPPQGDSPMSTVDANPPLLPTPPALLSFKPATTPYDPQTWLAQMFTSIIDAGISARDSIILGQTSDATSRGREMIEALRLVTDYMSQYSPNISEESADPFNLEHPVVPLPGPLDHTAMTQPFLNEHRKRSSATGFPQPKASVRKLSHSVTPKTEPEVITIPDLHLDVPSMSPTFVTPVPSSIATPAAALPAISRPPSRMFLDPSLFPAQSQPSHFGPNFEMSAQAAQLAPLTPGDIPVNALNVTATTDSGSQAIPPLPLPLTSAIGLEGPHEIAAPVFTNVSVPPVGISPAATITYAPGVQRMTRVSRSGSLTLPFERQPSFVAQTAPSSVAPAAAGPTNAFTPSDATDEGEGLEDEDQSESSTTTKHGLEIPADQLQEIDRIFLGFLQSLCSNLDATDKNGEPIHQALMPKKMEKFAQSKDFRPFKFRIQAFTHAFIDELAKHGYTDNKIQCKKVRQYLWRQPYIMRFNEEGKKAKSKGNHIWVIEARRTSDGWDFRKFVRKFANCHSSVCYVGQPWSWTPHIWDPQASLKDIPVRYESQNLPHWLSWKVTENGYVLSGTPPADAQSVEIRTEAQFVVDGKEERISMSFPLHVTPPPGVRRPSLSDSTSSRRSMSDSALPQRPSGQPAAILNAPRSDPKFVATVTEVLRAAVQRVQHERISQNISLEPPQFDALCKQQQVLSRAVSAYTEEQRNPGFLQPTNGSDPQAVLAKTAEQVVVQAVHTVIADKAAGVGVPVASAPKNASIVEVSAITQEALAKALERTTLHAHEVHVMQTTSKVLKEQEQALSPTASHFDNSMITETPTLVRVRSVPASLSAVPEHPF